MEIDHLMERFAAIPGAQVGHGPAHPEHPDPQPGDEMEEFLRTYPALRRDEGYVTFLRRYAGAAIDDEERYLLVDLLGFTDASTAMSEMEGPVVDDQGFLLFAQVVRHVIEDGMLRDSQEYDYAFDATGDREPGVYWLFSATSRPESLETATRTQGFLPAGEDFTGWLTRIVDTRGEIPPPAAGG